MPSLVKTARPAKTTPSRTVRAMGTPERGKANTVTSEAVSGMASLVCDRLFGTIDHDNVNRATLRVELETQLFLQGSEDRR